MAVIVRKDVVIDGKKYSGCLVYMSDKLVTKEAKEQAERLDALLYIKMNEIQKEMRDSSLLKLKGKPGVLKLWYEVGKRLSFVDAKEIDPDDRKYVWRALFDHAGAVAPGTPKSRAEGARNHFRYCSIIGRLPWPFVDGAGDWSAWVEFLDSPEIREEIQQNDRIVKWLASKSEKAPESRRNWLRSWTPEVRLALRNKDTSVYTDKELYEILDGAFEKAFKTES